MQAPVAAPFKVTLPPAQTGLGFAEADGFVGAASTATESVAVLLPQLLPAVTVTV